MYSGLGMNKVLTILGLVCIWLVFYSLLSSLMHGTMNLKFTKSGYCKNIKNWTELNHRYHNSRNFYITYFLLCVCKTVKNSCIINRSYNFPSMYIFVCTSNNIRLISTLIYLRPQNNQDTVFWDVTPYTLVQR
jgi:hypothetical protein